MINPTVGRVVWYRPGAHELNLSLSDQPLAAIVTYVHSDELINLVVFGKGGDCHQRASVPLWNGEGDAPEARLSWAEWMPHQKGPAAKLEEAEAKAGEQDVEPVEIPAPPVEPGQPAVDLVEPPDDPYATVTE